MREPVMLFLFKGGVVEPVIVSVSDTIEFESYSYPLYGRLAFTVRKTMLDLSFVHVVQSCRCKCTDAVQELRQYCVRWAGC